MSDTLPAASTDRDVYMTRMFDAPRDVVWTFFTDPEKLTQWFGPHTFPVPPGRALVDARVGGAWNLTMVGEDGTEAPITSTIRQLRPPEYLELVMPSPLALDETLLLRLQFHDHGERTRLTLHQGPFAEQTFVVQTEEGWAESFEKLVAAVAVA